MSLSSNLIIYYLFMQINYTNIITLQNKVTLPLNIYLQFKKSCRKCGVSDTLNVPSVSDTPHFPQFSFNR